MRRLASKARAPTAEPCLTDLLSTSAAAAAEYTSPCRRWQAHRGAHRFEFRHVIDH